MSPLNVIAAMLLTCALGIDRCREICEKVNFQDQCGTCQARPPIRFGKRSGEIQLRFKTLADQPFRKQGIEELEARPCCNHLLSLLMERAAQNTGDSAVQFQLEYQ